jgi:oxygen-independent coproporphyrinogen-3 oxidase
MGNQTEQDIPQALLGHYDHLGCLIADSPFAVDHGIDSSTFAAALSRHTGELEDPVSLYVHIPFCAVRCLNCDRNTTISHDPAEIDRYLDAVDEEMAQVAERLGAHRPVRQLRLGGGTPNYLSDTQLVRLMEIVGRHFRVSGETDASLEANPCRTSASQLNLLYGLGFRRIDFSIGDLDPRVQLAIGRVQSPAMIQDALELARGTGFESVNLGLRYGLPQQTMASLDRTLTRLIALSPDRISCQSFSHRPAQLAHQRAIYGVSPRTSLADRLCLFDLVVEGLTGAGYQWIGLDCFTRTDDELSLAQAQHRLRRDWLGYTPYPAADFFGFGTNAISELDGLCVQNHLEIPRWRDALAQHLFPVCSGVQLDAPQMKRRDAISTLMCNLELLDRDALFGLGQQEADDDLWSDFARRGLIDVLPDRVRLTEQGRHTLHHLWNGSDPGVRADGLSWQATPAV